jgi:RES domain
VHSFDSLYLAEDHMTSLKEVRSVLDNPHGPPFVASTPPWVLLTVIGQATDVIDLTDLAVQAEFGTTSSELSGEWVWSQKEFLLGRAPMPPTQLLGQLAYGSRVIKGLRFRSAPNVSSGAALLLFPDRLTSADSLDVYDNESPPVLAQRLPSRAQ